MKLPDKFENIKKMRNNIIKREGNYFKTENNQIKSKEKNKLKNNLLKLDLISNNFEYNLSFFPNIFPFHFYD